MTGTSFDVVRVSIGQQWCPSCDATTTHYGADCIGCCSPEPRAIPCLPREDGLGFGLHATTPPTWRVNWPAVAWAVVWIVGIGAWLMAGYGVYRWIAG